MELAKAILWIVVLAVFIWLGIEVVFLIRKFRKRLGGVMDNLEQTVASANKAIEDLNPAIQEIQPLLAKTETAVDALALDLLHANEILGNVNTVTGAASKATNAVTGAVERAGDAIQGAAAKLTGKKRRKKKAKALKGDAATPQALEGDIEVEDVVSEQSDEGYFTYEKPNKKRSGNADND